MEKRRKAKKRISALTSFLLALALLTGTLGALPAECFAAQPEKAAFSPWQQRQDGAAIPG